MPLLRYLPTPVTDATAHWSEGDLGAYAELALRELRASVDSVREYSDLLESYLIAREPRCLELREITREIRAQADLVASAIDAALQPELF